MVGGPSGNPVWVQIVADVIGLPIVLSQGQYAGALGAAIMAGIGVGLFVDEAQGFEAVNGTGEKIMPQKNNQQIYNKLFVEWKFKGRQKNNE